MSTIRLLIKTRRSLYLTSHATFSTNRNYLEPKSIQVTVPAKKDDTSPVVLLLGWVGCQDRHLQKYSKIYEDRGMTTVRFTAPMVPLFVQRTKILGLAEGVLSTIEDHRLQQRPILVHTFSNGGAYFFWYMSEVINSTNRALEIRGQIFDSGPCSKDHLRGFFNVVKEVIGKDKIYSSLLASLGLTGVILYHLFQYPVKAFQYLTNDPRYKIETDPFKASMVDRNTFPQLFLYSKEDHLLPFKDVEQFAKERKKQGVDVTSYCFEGSDHVSHFVKFPQLYLDLVDKFLRKCLVKEEKFDFRKKDS